MLARSGMEIGGTPCLGIARGFFVGRSVQSYVATSSGPRASSGGGACRWPRGASEVIFARRMSIFSSGLHIANRNQRKREEGVGPWGVLCNLAPFKARFGSSATKETTLLSPDSRLFKSLPLKLKWWLHASHQHPLIRAPCTTAPAHTSSLVSRITRTRAPTSPRSIGFCAIWDCISPSSSSK